MDSPGQTSRPTLFFAHANGFPAGSYRCLFSELESRFAVVAPEQVGHHPNHPVGDNWRTLVDELLDAMSAAGPDPVLGVGHSLGGVLTFLAALRQPRRFRAFIMLDPPIVFGWTGWLVRAAKHLGFIDRITPAGVSVGRRERWPDRASAIAHFRDKPLFRDFAPQCLTDYVAAGTVPDGDGVRLGYDPAVELAIFRHLPDDLGRQPAPVGVPGAVIRALRSDVTRAADLRRMQRRHRLLVRTFDGGHMFPLEQPEAAARQIAETLGMLQDDGAR